MHVKAHTPLCLISSLLLLLLLLLLQVDLEVAQMSELVKTMTGDEDEDDEDDEGMVIVVDRQSIETQNEADSATLPAPTCDYDYTEENEVPLVNVKKHVLAKVLDYCKHHVHNPPKDIQKVSGTHTQLRTPPCTCIAPHPKPKARRCPSSRSTHMHCIFALLFHFVPAFEDCQSSRDRVSLGCRIRQCPAGDAVRPHPSRQLHGHQAATGPDLCQGGLHDQGQDARGDPKDLQH